MINAARLKITLVDLDPTPWRMIEVPLSMSFKGLHDAIQAAFGWMNAHLWEFELDGRRYGPPIDFGFDDDRVYNAANARLTKLRDMGVGAFLYTYDMGDDWAHRVEVVELFDAAPDLALPRFIEGRWRRPPEDVGGPPGFENFLDALVDPKHPDHAELLGWHGGPFDAENIDEDIIQIEYKRLANARRRRKR